MEIFLVLIGYLTGLAIAWAICDKICKSEDDITPLLLVFWPILSIPALAYWLTSKILDKIYK